MQPNSGDFATGAVSELVLLGARLALPGCPRTLPYRTKRNVPRVISPAGRAKLALFRRDSAATRGRNATWESKDVTHPYLRSRRRPRARNPALRSRVRNAASKAGAAPLGPP